MSQYYPLSHYSFAKTSKGKKVSHSAKATRDKSEGQSNPNRQKMQSRLSDKLRSKVVFMSKSKKIIVQGSQIGIILHKGNNDFISLTDIAKLKNKDAPADVVKNWMRTHSTIEFLGLREKINNPNFKHIEFDVFKNKLEVIHLSSLPKNG